MSKQNSDVQGSVFTSLSNGTVFLLNEVTHVFGNSGFVKVILNKKIVITVTGILDRF